VIELTSSMESQSEELSRLRAEVASLKELLTSKDVQMASAAASNAALLGCKDELLAITTRELQHCKEELLQHRAASLDAAAGDSSKRQRLYYSSTAESPLERDDILDYVLSLVGGGDHLYTGGVCRRWRGRYLQYCAKHKSKHKKQCVTRQRSVLMTESRLKLALSSGLTVTDWRFDTVQKAELICKLSLELEKVMALLRVHVVPWSTKLCEGAARYNKLEQLRWLRANSCPWKAERVLRYASMHGAVAMLQWLLTVTAPWSPDIKRAMLHAAACHNTISVVQWLRAPGAVWPKSFCWIEVYRGIRVRKCWKLPAVQWALASGSGWLHWRCENYAAEKYEDVHYKQQAAELLEWAHANGCPCTCGHAQQQQQQQQQ
jgi:hypothetical protein